MSKTTSKFDIRKIGLIFIIAILFTVFVFTSIDAVYPTPNYNDFCEERFIEKPVVYKDRADCKEIKGPSETETKACTDKKRQIAYEYDEFNCPKSYSCETCQNEYDTAREEHSFVVFIISAIFALIAIIIAFYLPTSSRLNEWIGTGFLLGGLLTLFFGTIMVFGDLHRFVKPPIILAELILVIFLAYKKIKK